MESENTQTQILKPPMPVPAPAVTFNATASLLSDFGRYSNGRLAMTISTVDIAEGEDKIGWIGVDPGCNVSVKIKERLYSIKALDIYRSVLAQDSAVSSKASGTHAAAGKTGVPVLGLSEQAMLTANALRNMAIYLNTFYPGGTVALRFIESLHAHADDLMRAVSVEAR